MEWLKVDSVERNDGGRQIVHSTSLLALKSERIAIAGETGSGKSTLLKMIAGLVQPSAGYLFFEGEKVSGPEEQLIPGHKDIAYLSQHFELRNNYTVFDLLDYGSELPPAEAQQLFSICEIDHLLKRKTNSGLSGGERQRIALAKLLATKPKLLLLDEPFSNLDPLHKQTIKQVIQNISDQLNISIILVSHDPFDTLSWATRIIVMRHGSIVQDASPDGIYHRPVSTYTAGLFGIYNLFETDWLLRNNLLADHSISASHYLIRPEDISINTAEASYPAEIKSCLFCGPYYLATLQTGNLSLQAILHHSLAPGTSVSFSINSHHLWPITD